MLDTLNSWDVAITRFIHTSIPHNGFFDAVFSFLSMQGGSIFIWTIILLLLILFEEKRNHRFILSFAISVGGVFLLVNYVLKILFARPRPDFLTTLSTYICPTNFAFPSGHAAVAFAAATILSFYDKKRRYWYYGLAVLISLSRIYLGCHFFFDVVGGGIIGFSISYLILKVFSRRK